MSDQAEGMVSRREMLRMLAAGGTTFILAACGRTGEQIVPMEATSPPATTGVSSATATPATASGTLPAGSPAAPPAATATPAPWRPPTTVRITPNAEFYTMKYNPSPPPEVDLADYRLVIDGEVDNPLSLSLEEIKSFPAYEEMRTLQCISNPVGGNLIGNANWKGIRLADLLEAAGARSSGRNLMLESLDGYHTGIPIDLAWDEHSLLVYEMNGETLPPDHGYPIRCLWPGRYGQKQPKWLQKITLQRSHHVGHWEGAGWSDDAFIQPTSIIEHPEGRQPLPPDFFVGGVAYTVREGVEKVEVSLDDGVTWQEAELLRGPSPLVWSHWWLQLSGLEPAAYRILARTTDNLGQRQRSPGRNSSLLDNTFPNGTDEMHRVVAQVRSSGS